MIKQCNSSKSKIQRFRLPLIELGAMLGDVRIWWWLKTDLLDVTYALKLAKATYNKMVQNLIWATGYDIIGIPLAAGVAYLLVIVLSPALAAVFMTVSTVVVSINAILLRRVKLD